MSQSGKQDILGWFGLNRGAVWSVARWLGPLFSVVVFVLFVMALAAAFAMLGHALFDLGLDAPRAGFGTGAVIVALLGAPFVIWRAIVAQKQADVAEQGHITDRINKAVEGLGAEKTVKNQLANDDGTLATDADGKYVTVERTIPNLEVRIGAIYALERIAQDSDRDHVQIMEILCAYIRHNAPGGEAAPWPELEMRKGEDRGPLEEDWEERVDCFKAAQRETIKGLRPREDIQVALDVIGRRTAKQRRLEARWGTGNQDAEFVFDNPYPELVRLDGGTVADALHRFHAMRDDWHEAAKAYRGYRLDLRGANLRRADLTRKNLNGARLSGAQIQGAYLEETLMQWADLEDAQMQTSYLKAARMQGANLEGARLQTANLMSARLDGACLWSAQLQVANLSGVKMQGASLLLARMQQASLLETQMQGAYLCDATMQGVRYLKTAALEGAALRDMDCKVFPELIAHFEHVFGDVSVFLPPGVQWPTHWPKDVLELGDFDEEWRKWQQHPEAYEPPASSHSAHGDPRPTPAANSGA